MSYEAIVADDESDEDDKRIVVSILTGKSLEEIILEDENRKKVQEFWSDPCWAE